MVAVNDEDTRTYIAYVGFERCMNYRRVIRKRLSRAGGERTKTSKMTGDMVALGTGRCAVSPFASEAEVVSALPAYVIVAEVVVEGLRVHKRLCTVEPLTVVER